MSDLKNLDAFVADSNDALEIKLIRKRSDLEDDSISFGPEMTHQIFGDGENIFGYKNLKIKLYYMADTLQTYLGANYSDKINLPGYICDDFLTPLSKRIPSGYSTNLDEFSKVIEENNKNDFTPHGVMINSFDIKDAKNRTRKFEVYHVDMTTPGFLNYHEKLQTFILFYIDAASFIDVDDDRWTFFLIYEKDQEDGCTKSKYSIVGYTTVYQYYAYPDNIRPRISQMLILPPFQKQGLGVKFLNTIYDYYRLELANTVIDITVEDPSEQFQRLRDYVDVLNCKDLPCFKPEALKEGFSKEMVNEINKKYKLTKKQIRRVYEIIKLSTVDMENKEEYKKYRLEIKNRLNVPYQREATYVHKLLKVFKLQEVRALNPMLSQEQRLQKLEKEYREIESQYKHVLKRLEL